MEVLGNTVQIISIIGNCFLIIWGFAGFAKLVVSFWKLATDRKPAVQPVQQPVAQPVQQPAPKVRRQAPYQMVRYARSLNDNHTRH